MKSDQHIDLSVLKLTSRLIVERALARGWGVTGYTSNNAIFSFDIPGKNRQVRIFSASPPQMSYPAVKVTNDKYITNQILGSIGMPVPKDKLIKINESFENQRVQEFLEELGTVVVKPLDSSHGNGITVDITSQDQLLEALNDAKAHTKKSVVLMQQQVAGFDVRLLCIDYKFAGAITRTPAQVIGDGVHTVEELTIIVNKSDDRGENYKGRLNFIDTTASFKYLGEKKLQIIPEAGEIVQVIGVANIGMGGERKNIYDDTPDFLIEIAEKAVKELDLPVCAVDFMTAVEPKKNITIEELNPFIIELNGCPQLLIYDDPQSPEQKAFIDKYLDLVAKY